MRLRVVSLNLWHGGKLLPAVVDFLRTQNADVVLLQEVFASADHTLPPEYRSISSLKQQLDYEYDDFAQAYITDLPVGLVPQGNGILSRLPIASRTARFLVEPIYETYKDEPEYWPIEPRVLQNIVLRAEVGEVNVLNFHGVWDLDGDNPSDDRQRMVDIILQEAGQKQRVIVAGDTNAKQSNPAMLRLAQTLPSVFGDSVASTFNMQQKTNPGYATAAVDHMYTSSDIRILASECPVVNISDHLPLVVDLEVV